MDNNNRGQSNNQSHDEEITWDSIGDELFYRKNKFYFTGKEKTLIKQLLLNSPPPLRYRRKVRYNIIYKLIS